MRVKKAQEAMEAGDHSLAGEYLAEALLVNPDDVDALYLTAKSIIEHDKPGLALAVCEKLVRLRPDNAVFWAYLGKAELSLQRPVEAEKALKEAQRLTPDDGDVLHLLSAVCVMSYRFDEAIDYAKRSLALKDRPWTHAQLAFAYLNQRKWGLGWDEYHLCRNWMKWRHKLDYGIPEWEGQKGSLLVYGEQGLGDQIAYLSSCAKLQGRVVQVDCHSKIKHLIARSLNCEAHNFNHDKPINWEVRADYSINMSGFQKYATRTADQFYRKPYLVPHPLKSLQWRAALDSLGSRPKVGIAWTGGLPTSQGSRTRNLTIDQLRPILDLPFDWISLEYNRHEDIPGIHQWPWATQTQDYDDTAALVANLDAVVCVPTTVYHLAGGLGVPAHVIVHDTPHFHEGTSGQSPWWECVTFYRRPELGTDGAILAVKEALSASIHR